MPQKRPENYRVVKPGEPHPQGWNVPRSTIYDRLSRCLKRFRASISKPIARLIPSLSLPVFIAMSVRAAR